MSSSVFKAEVISGVEFRDSEVTCIYHDYKVCFVCSDLNSFV